MPIIDVAARANRRNIASLTEAKRDQTGFFVFLDMEIYSLKFLVVNYVVVSTK